MSNKKAQKSYVTVPHIEGCTSVGTRWEWSGLIKGHYFGNAYGRSGGHHVWHQVICNDPNCPAIKIVNSSVLIEA